MILRFSIALILAVTFLVLGITIRFAEPKPEVDVAIFFEIAGELPGVEFSVGDSATWSPAIVCVGDSDPGLLKGAYPGHVLSMEFPEVDPGVFLRSNELFSAVLPDETLLEVRRDGVGRMFVGNAELFWSCFIAGKADAAGVEGNVLVLGIAVHDEEARFPSYFRAARAIAVPFTVPEGSAPVIGRFRQRAIHFEGPTERPTRLTHKISVDLSFEQAEVPPPAGKPAPAPRD